MAFLHTESHSEISDMTSDNDTSLMPWILLSDQSQPGIILTVFGACLFGAVVRTLLQTLKLPYTVLLALCGMLLGTLSFQYPEVSYYTKEIAHISPKLLIHTFMPVLIFSSAFEIESHIFWKSLIQVLLLAIPGFLLSSSMIALLVVKVYAYNWDWYVGMMFGAIVSTIDPFISTALLRSLGTAKPLILLIEGESLFSDGASIITFDAFKDLATDLSHFEATTFTIKLILKVFGSPLLGFIMSKIIMFWLSYIFNDGLIEITISLAMTYITFYFAEWLGMSGVIAVLIMGLLLDTVNFSPEIEVFLLRFWEMLTYLANTLIFFIVGIVVARAFQHVGVNDFFNIVVLYFAMYIIRLVTVIALSPFLVRTGYGFSWRWAAVCVWGGTKGAFCLSLTLMAFQSDDLDEEQVREKILVLSSGMVVLTLLINASSMTWFLRLLGLYDVSVPRRMAMYSAVQRVRESSQNTFSLLKIDRFLADANWEMAEQRVLIEDPYKTPNEKVSIEEFSPTARMTKCPDCDRDIPYAPSPQELEDMMEEARMRILKAQKTSYWKQYSAGMLNREAARTLINTAENMTDHKGKFMSVQDVKKYWELKGFFVSLRRSLEDWLYNVKLDKLKPSRNAMLKRCYQVVFSLPFEYFIYALIVLNIFPIILEFIPAISDKHNLELSIINYIFFSGYLVEAILKALAMRKAYIFNHWNQFDLFIIVLACVDIFLDHYLETTAYVVNIHMIKIVKVSKMIRLTRALRLVKIIIPKLIEIINRQIHKQLSFGYDIGKGYVIGEEHISKIIDHISDDKSISKKLKIILERNCQQAVREIGLLQRDHPEIAISVKTRQAIRAVLNSERDAIHTLVSGGLLDDIEASKLEKMIEIKMKKLIKFPPTIPAATAEELLQNLPWLNKDSTQIQFIKTVAKLLFFDFGDTIIQENDDPQGIHLIVSGLVKMTGGSPNLGGKRPKEKTRLTDYRSCGAIMGELNCLTQQSMEMTVTCETATQTCFIAIESLFEAFDVFPEFPSLEYMIWRSLAVKISTSTFMEHIIYQGWSYHRICSHLARAYLVDVEVNRKFDVYDGTMEDVVVIYGSCDDLASQCSYNAPALISRTTHQVLGTANTTKLLIVPSEHSEMKQTVSELPRQDSVPCLRHAAHRRASRDDRSGLLRTVSVMSKEGSPKRSCSSLDKAT
ncbi:sodium/hydrogen exchanger 10 [Oncorhynchus tshawytscha]|uniref:Solute carrier family 9 member C1 n=2 Tax=Oncorhynchus TaxID=8016 RepID=A0A8C7J9C6_ONCKI|nr:sodium/hydrogen exchanger 10 [Oncorhynchus kisutch]XP_031657139.1 sodium/hydrogen exchanger 10 [Oncorhynchus kisutch]XP_042157377.1 sodium/hydrogen exchanger 10 [Oncorhynchus tshawytscha]